jgi:hypothetical protein
MVTSCIGRKAARTTSFGSPAVPPTADRSMPGGRFRAPAEKVLFQLPITEGWIRQFVLAQSLIGHSSDRGVQELAAVLVGYHLSLGTIHNILSQAADRAQKLNQQEDLRLLPGIRVGAHDEIFQGGRPVLVGIDTDSTYCYLLAPEAHRDAETWALHLLELGQRGLHLDRTIADGGSCLRAGQSQAWGDLPCHGDVFHAERQVSSLAYFLERRAEAGLGVCEDLSARLERCQHARDQARGYGGKRGKRRADRARRLGRRLASARRDAQKIVPLADDVALLSRWLREDVFAVAGEDLPTRRALYDFIVEQLAQLEPLCPYRIGPVVRMLQEQREQLLGFVGVLDEQLEALAAEQAITMHWVREICRLQALDRENCLYWQRRQRLHRKLGWRLAGLERAVKQVLRGAVRSSSAVENLNSRLRCYFFLRRQVGAKSLELLRFFLNHHVYRRSRLRWREGRSPAELVCSAGHPHWLAMLDEQLWRYN